MNNEQDPAFHMLLWDEDEYGYGVSFNPPLIFANFQAAVKAAKKITRNDDSYRGIYIVPVDLTTAAPTEPDIYNFCDEEFTGATVRNGELYYREKGYKYVKAGS